MERPITILYFAKLSAERGLAQETVATSAADVAALYEELRASHNLTVAMENVRFAVNHEFVSPEHPLSDNDTVACMPPFCGG